MSTLMTQQMSFEEFREFYSDDVCATSGPPKLEAGADQINTQTPNGREGVGKEHP